MPSLMPERRAGVDRRTALGLMAAASALSTTACSPPAEQIIPYVDMPEGMVPGSPRWYATAVPMGGWLQPALVESHEGRPTKIEGNPDHPLTRGGTDAFMQAAVLSLYDPARAKTLTSRSEVSTWTALQALLLERGEAWARDGGVGLRLLSGRITSPTLASQLALLARRYPRMRHHVWEPLDTAAERAGTAQAFGRPLDTQLHLDKAKLVLSLDADIIGPGPCQAAHARAFSQGRRARAGTPGLLRLFTVEPSPTLTGIAADRHLPYARSGIVGIARAVAQRLGAPIRADAPEGADAFVTEAVRALEQHQGEALVVAGAAQPPEAHALAAWINQRLGAIGSTVTLHEPADDLAPEPASSLAGLARDLHAGRVDTLVILDANPVYDAPADLRMAQAIAAAPLSIHLGLYADETSAACTWQVPLRHGLESWGDGRAVDGTVSIIQPLIAPLFEGMTATEFVATLAGQPGPAAHDLVRTTWRARAGTQDFEAWWRRTLHDGLIAGTPTAPVANLSAARLPPPTLPQPAKGAFEVVFLPDHAVWDGRFAANAWLQEMPRPVSKLVWGNAAFVAPEDAEAASLEDGDLVRLEVGTRAIELPALRTSGQARGTIGLSLGYGRRQAGIGSGVGTDVYPLRSTDALWAVPGVALTRTGSRVELALTQRHHDMHERDIVRSYRLEDLAGLAKEAAEPALPSLYAEPEYGRHAWGMVIDQSVCIGCNACVVACQAENNVPVVGADEVRRGRSMHWLRIDSYEAGTSGELGTLFQPVPCMHCENAPCEPVCPVEASVHDHEGLNVQVYNRCVGTRFCQANCPYKVRRFNFFPYAEEQVAAEGDRPLIEAVHNPDVTVRGRGVMEKCTYCVQRISRARHRAEAEDRPLDGDEVVTACEAACPTQAIFFGDLTQPRSDVATLRHQPHHYALLEHLGTRPRTTYLARVRATPPDEPA